MFSTFYQSFYPKKGATYKIVLDNKETINLTFTEENDVYEEEEYAGYDNYESYDEDKKRYIYYVQKYQINNDCCLKSRDIEGEEITYYIAEIYHNNKLVYDNT